MQCMGQEDDLKVTWRTLLWLRHLRLWDAAAVGGMHILVVEDTAWVAMVGTVGPSARTVLRN